VGAKRLVHHPEDGIALLGCLGLRELADREVHRRFGHLLGVGRGSVASYREVRAVRPQEEGRVDLVQGDDRRFELARGAVLARLRRDGSDDPAADAFVDGENGERSLAAVAAAGELVIERPGKEFVVVGVELDLGEDEGVGVLRGPTRKARSTWRSRV